ncbi:hypothetical protein ACIBCN_13375 [Nocardia sp. NPDC051052]|uniref:hypothetical protein n=1 Tax=Nocardia sp. NPDC051052 TaxID=3364322 RepID=UPI003791C758
MRHRKMLVRMPIIGAFVAAVLLSSGATASAAGPYGAQLANTPTACRDFPLPAEINGNAQSRPDLGPLGTVGIWYGFQHRAFIYTPCTVTITAHWTNLDTGDTGAVDVPLSGGWGFALPANSGAIGRATFFTGVGRVSITTTTDMPHQVMPAAEFYAG